MGCMVDIELVSVCISIVSVCLALYAIYKAERLTTQTSQDNERIMKTINASSGQIRKDISEMKSEIFTWFNSISGIGKIHNRVKTSRTFGVSNPKKIRLKKLRLKWVSDRKYSGIQGNIWFRPDQDPKRAHVD